MGRKGNARGEVDPGALRQREAPGRSALVRLPARDQRNGQPGHRSTGRRRRGHTLRQQSTEHPGRRRGGFGPGVRHPDLRHQRRRRHDLLQTSGSGPRRQATDDHGRRRRPADPAPHQTFGPAGRRAGRHRGDHHRRYPADRHGRRGTAQVPGYRRQRRRDQALLRQPLRHRTEHLGRHNPGHQHPVGRTPRGDIWLRLVRPGRRLKGERHGRPCDRLRDQPGTGLGSGDGRVHGHAQHRGSQGRSGVHHRHRRTTCHRPETHQSLGQRGHPRQ